MLQANDPQKKIGAVMLMSDKIDNQLKMVMRHGWTLYNHQGEGIPERHNIHQYMFIK